MKIEIKTWLSFFKNIVLLKLNTSQSYFNISSAKKYVQVSLALICLKFFCLKIE